MLWAKNVSSETKIKFTDIERNYLNLITDIQVSAR